LIIIPTSTSTSTTSTTSTTSISCLFSSCCRCRCRCRCHHGCGRPRAPKHRVRRPCRWATRAARAGDGHGQRWDVVRYGLGDGLEGVVAAAVLGDACRVVGQVGADARRGGERAVLRREEAEGAFVLWGVSYTCVCVCVCVCVSFSGAMRSNVKSSAWKRHARKTTYGAIGQPIYLSQILLCGRGLQERAEEEKGQAQRQGRDGKCCRVLHLALLDGAAEN
jgi:hypothetical protein